MTRSMAHSACRLWRPGRARNGRVPASQRDLLRAFQLRILNEQSLNTSVYWGLAFFNRHPHIGGSTMNHTYNGLYIQTNAGHQPAHRQCRCSLGMGDVALETCSTRNEEVDPRLGVAYNIGTKRNVVVRAGLGCSTHHPSTLARVPGALLRRNHWQVPGTPV